MEPHQYPERFALMHYRCDSCRGLELVWNSRNGVSPFSIPCARCEEGIATHVSWEQDLRKPDWQLRMGQRFFRDGTPDEAVEIMRKRIAVMQDLDPLPQHRIDELLRDTKEGRVHEFRSGWPSIDVCTEGPKPSLHEAHLYPLWLPR